MTFNEMNLIPALLEAVEKSGYTRPTPIQAQTIPLTLAGKDILGCAQTGTGKTAAFALPILQLLYARISASDTKKPRHIRALILAPTRELAQQNYEAFAMFGEALDIHTCVIFGGVNQKPQVDRLESGVDILVATPGRLNDLIGQGFIKLNQLEIFVLDEADRMLDMGFIHDVKAVIALLPKQRQTLLFSATMPAEVEELALGLLKSPETVKVDPVTSTVDKIQQQVYFVAKENKPDTLMYLLNEKNIYTALVFTRTKHGADQVVKTLTKNGINSMAIHGNKGQTARQLALSNFKTGKIDVLVATDIAARGIDIAELPFVINYNVPEEPEAYIHRIGRTGRAGLGGTAITLCCSDELSNWQSIEKLIHKSVPVSLCEWSVQGMIATKYVKPQRPPRASRQKPPSPAKPVTAKPAIAKSTEAKSAEAKPFKEAVGAKKDFGRGYKRKYKPHSFGGKFPKKK